MNVKNETKADIIFDGVRGGRCRSSTFDNNQHQSTSSAALQMQSSLLETKVEMVEAKLEAKLTTQELKVKMGDMDVKELSQKIDNVTSLVEKCQEEIGQLKVKEIIGRAIELTKQQQKENNNKKKKEENEEEGDEEDESDESDYEEDKDDEEEEEDKEKEGHDGYVVTKIWKRTMDRNGNIKYHVRWEGHGRKLNSWKARETIAHMDAVKKYEANNVSTSKCIASTSQLSSAAAESTKGRGRPRKSSRKIPKPNETEQQKAKKRQWE